MALHYHRAGRRIFHQGESCACRLQLRTSQTSEVLKGRSGQRLLRTLIVRPRQFQAHFTFDGLAEDFAASLPFRKTLCRSLI